MGPFRMTFSKSGISTSFGVKGARLTVAPRGTYVTVGAGGIYYRHRIATAPVQEQPGVPQPVETWQPSDTNSPNAVEMVDMAALVSVSSDEVVQDISQRWGKFEWSKITLWSAIASGLMVVGNPVMIVLTVALGVATLYLRDYEKREKTVRLNYQLDHAAHLAYGGMFAFWDRLSSTHRLWSIVTSTATDDWKRNAGASNLIQRKQVTLSKGTPRFLETNVQVYSLSTGPYRLYFLPDRLLVQANGVVTAVPYHRLHIEGSQTRFIEDDAVPGDTVVVGNTWRYVNKGGGPDRRFSNNRQLPVCLYGAVELESPPGLRIHLHCSNPHVSVSATESFHAIRSLSATAGVR